MILTFLLLFQVIATATCKYLATSNLLNNSVATYLERYKLNLQWLLTIKQ